MWLNFNLLFLVDFQIFFKETTINRHIGQFESNWAYFLIITCFLSDKMLLGMTNLDYFS